MAVTNWGIIGPGAIAHNFANGLKEAKSGKLVAIASRDAKRRKEFGDEYDIADGMRFDSYEALAASPDIHAVYISTPHPWHAELSIMAMRHGKAVVCEKPAGMNAGEVTAVTEVAAQAGVFFMEAFMYRCHPQIARLVGIIRNRGFTMPILVVAEFWMLAVIQSRYRVSLQAPRWARILTIRFRCGAPARWGRPAWTRRLMGC
jgi:predicted dehydrogenase